jgi:glycosyltransferase involved in cell wall biosynthesis
MGLAGSRLDRRPDAPLRVVMVVRLFLPWIGGTERQAHRLAQQLVKEGVEVRVVTGRWFRGTPRRETIDGIEVFRNHALWEFFGIKGLRKLGGYFYILTLVWHLWRSRHGYDVIHVHSLNYHTFAAVLAGRLTGRPVIVKLANSGPASDIERMRRGQQLALSGLMLRTALRCDRFVALNQAIVRDLIACGVERDRIVRIPNGVEASPRGDVERTYDLHAPVRVVFVGRLHQQKGVQTLLHSLGELRRRSRGLSISLQLVGDGPERTELAALATRLGVSDDVAFLGSRTDVGRLLRRSDIFVLPSRAEGLSNALLEAMSVGLPVVVSNIPGNEDVVDHLSNGLLFRVDDSTSLASAVMRLLDDPDLRRAVGRQARLTVIERYGFDGVARRYLALYEKLLASEPTLSASTEARRT